jgi:citrate lyase beta subunit
MKLLIIENNSERAVFYTENGIDRIFVDLEYLGKEVRQKNMDTVKSFSHKSSDVKKIKDSIKKGELLVRINPINSNSVDEINEVIDYGADLIMLPYFKTIKEVDFFLKTVNNRCKTILLVETPQAFTRLPNYIISVLTNYILG